MLQPHIAANLTNEELIKYVNRDNTEINELCKRIESLIDNGNDGESIDDAISDSK